MVFYITITHDRRKIRLKVELIEQNNTIEKLRITARNQSFVLQSNRPILKNKGLKYRKPNYKVTEGGYSYSFILEQIIVGIENYLEK